ncbi:MAG: hypothetical protein WA666_02385 [Nitrospirota bacterium]
MNGNEGQIVLAVIEKAIAEENARHRETIAELEQGREWALKKISGKPFPAQQAKRLPRDTEQSLFPPIKRDGEKTVKQRFIDAIEKKDTDFYSDEIFKSVNSDGGPIVAKKSCVSTFGRLKGSAYQKLPKRRGGRVLYRKIVKSEKPIEPIVPDDPTEPVGE